MFKKYLKPWKFRNYYELWRVIQNLSLLWNWCWNADVCSCVRIFVAVMPSFELRSANVAFLEWKLNQMDIKSQSWLYLINIVWKSSHTAPVAAQGTTLSHALDNIVNLFIISSFRWCWQIWKRNNDLEILSMSKINLTKNCSDVKRPT